MMKLELPLSVSAVPRGSRYLASQPPSPRVRCHTTGTQARLLVPRLPLPLSNLWGSQEVAVISVENDWRLGEGGAVGGY